MIGQVIAVAFPRSVVDEFAQEVVFGVIAVGHRVLRQAWGGVGHGVAVDAVGDVLSGAAGVDPEALTLGGGLGLSVPPVGEVVQFFDAFDARADALDDHPASASAQPLVLTRLRSSGPVVVRELAGLGAKIGWASR